MKHLGHILGICVLAAATGLTFGPAESAGAEPAGGTATILKEVVQESTIVKTKTLYSFPEAKAPDKTAPAGAEAPAQAEGGYRIGPGDTLEFQLFDDTGMNREVKVRYDGYISLPQISEMKVVGMTRDEALEGLIKAYEEVYKKPHIALTVKEAAGTSFFILGDVEKPAEYPYTRPITVLQALNIAGGPRVTTMSGDSYIGAQGQLSKAFVIRHRDGKREVHEYDLSGVRKDGENPSDAPVLPGDTVYLPEGMNLVYVMGETLTPGVYPLVEGMTLLALLARAGGANEKMARMRSVLLLRQVDEENTEVTSIDLRKALDMGYSPKLKAGDIVYVPRGKLVRLYDNLMRFTRLTETVSPLLNLYMQGYDTYYRKDLYDVLLNPQAGTSTGVSVPATSGGGAAKSLR
jgi:polysaccharide export outer membrane protein